MSEVSASKEISKNSNNDETARGNNEKSKDIGEQHTEGTKLDNEDVQRAIEGLAEIPDDQLQEFLNDEDFMEGLDVVDAWEGDTDKTHKSSRGPRNREREHTKSSRERPRRERNCPHHRERAKRGEDRRRDDARRDPFKSSKDIERDKIRTKKDTASKILAEKEKAIKHLLDSDDPVPPGTEVEVIQDITEKQQNSDRTPTKTRKSRERRRSLERRRSQERRGISPPRRRSSDRIRLSPSRRISDERRPIRISPERRRTAVSPPLRRSWERRASRERSLERQRRRDERELRLAARRSRSRDRQRSRSTDRYRKRWSRSPNGRRSTPRRHSRSRTPERRPRKRSPFINEIARQFGKEGLMSGGPPTGFLPGIPPLMGTGFAQDQASPVPQPPMQQQFMHHPGPPGPSGIHMQPGGGQPFVNFDLGPPMNFDQGRGPMQLHPSQTDYAAGPIMYNQGNPSRPMQQQTMIGPPIHTMPMNSPQPVPAPGPSEHSSSITYNRCPNNIIAETHNTEMSNRRAKTPKTGRISYKDLKNITTSYNEGQTKRPDRLKTPEPPVISNSKPFEKTSLSSLLEASVSAKDSIGLPVLYPGFKPELLRQCELALRDLPAEDLRFRMKGRFFFDPTKEDQQRVTENLLSNSILLRTGRSKIHWDDMEKGQNPMETMKPIVETHQKICQTDEITTDTKAIQVVILPKTAEFSQQVNPKELQQTAKEEKRPIMDRLDWNIRDNFDYVPKIREADDLRWSLSNSSQKRSSWNRGLSPPLVTEKDRRLSTPPLISLDHNSRVINPVSTTSRHRRDSFTYEHGSSRDNYSNERFSPSYRRESIERRETFHDSHSNHSRGESPMALEDESPDEVEIINDDHYPRDTDWRSRSSTSFGSSSALNKLRALRGKSAGRPYLGRSGFRGKF